MRRVVLVSMAWIVACSTFAHAHEKRRVGEYDLVVGFLNEPAFSGQLNGVDLKVSKMDTPVEGLSSTLKVAVTKSKVSRNLKLRTRYGKPGSYSGDFIPAEPGHYSFRLEGQIEELKVDETFSSESGKFSPVGDSKELVFPAL